MAIRDTIFIGHANPEDNDFTLWLYAKLKNEGFKVVCDLTFLTGGEEDYWDSLQTALDRATCKYLLVFSKKTFKKSGVKDEWEHVRSIAKREGLKDFVMLLKVDDVAFDARIGTNKMNQFRFDYSWANGFKRLIYKLQKDEVPKLLQHAPLSINDWLKNKYTTFSGVVKKKEIFYSNWLDIPSYPDTIYFHRYLSSKQVEAIRSELDSYPSIQHDTYLVTFVARVPTRVSGRDFEIPPVESLKIKADKVFKEYENQNFPGFHDLRRLFVRLMKEILHRYFESLGMATYQLSGRKLCYYYPKDNLEKSKVSFIYEGRKTRKNLVGKYGDSYWHHAISIHPLLSPTLCYSLKSHIVFTDDGETAWDSKSKMHTARRSKGKNYFNKDWRAFILAFLRSICNEDEDIRIALDHDLELVLPSKTLIFNCNNGYQEPIDKGRLVPIDYSEELEEWLDEYDDQKGEDE